MAASIINRGGRLTKDILRVSSRSLTVPHFHGDQERITNKGIRCYPVNNRFVYPETAGYSTLIQSDNADILHSNVDIELKGHDPMVLNSYGIFLGEAAKELEVDIYQMTTPTKKINRLSLLKSVHVHKKHFVQYETRTHYKTIHIKNITGSTTDTYLEYIQRNLPEGVFMKVTKCQLESLPDHIKPPAS